MNTVEYNDEGQQITVPIRQDLCNTCAVPTPRRQRKSDSLDNRIAALEQQNAKLDQLTEQIKNVQTGPPAS